MFDFFVKLFWKNNYGEIIQRRWELKNLICILNHNGTRGKRKRSRDEDGRDNPRSSHSLREWPVRGSASEEGWRTWDVWDTRRGSTSESVIGTRRQLKFNPASGWSETKTKEEIYGCSGKRTRRWWWRRQVIGCRQTPDGSGARQRRRRRLKMTHLVRTISSSVFILKNGKKKNRKMEFL